MKSLAMLTFWMLILVPITTYANDLSGYIVCHNSMAGRIVYDGKEIELKVDAERYQDSAHGFLSCTECHERFSENPHTSPAEVVSADVERLSKKISQKADVDAVALAEIGRASCRERG